ncbi:S8 family serine peptidase [Asticcacaulis solisilvae]|uniref:S8 family serine peptidase n=1 Tax=Asticcacaulis solisilvae TaxID=1217274 RepID=UPI003FD769F8
MKAFVLISALLLAAGPASAQLGGHLENRLGNLTGNLPSLPVVRDVTGAVDRTLDGTLDRVSGLASQRLDTVRDLVAQHRDVLEQSPQGDLIVRHEIVATAPSDAALAAAKAAGFTVTRTDTLENLGLSVVVLAAPKGVSTNDALRRLKKLDPDGVYDFNDIYLGSQSASAPGGGSVNGAGGGRVGLIDSGVDTGHPAFQGARITQKGFAGAPQPGEHGTETASLLIGRADGFAGAAPGADLYVADVYCNAPTGGSTPAILQALDWMAKERVAVVNISLVGPSNAPMKAAVAAMVARGHLIVAAVGNDGPAAKPLYPAAFDGVIGVTAIDRRNHVLPEAGRGPQVKFSAPGADISAARPGGYAAVRGTSFAAPIVAGLLSRQLRDPDPARARAAVEALAASAQDLGVKGLDTTYGNGLVGADIRPQAPPKSKK